ncbi:hypothetical protein [Streptomyces sp.]|uniref:hypothetical protein n=1 Tax=Streptomyces sp. TaxID=1931 RepID=UPI002F91CAFD
MDERRGEQQGAGSHPPIASAGSTLPPAQQAWSRYVTHRLDCLTCQDIDAGPCGESERLHRVWLGLSNRALDQIADKAN